MATTKTTAAAAAATTTFTERKKAPAAHSWFGAFVVLLCIATCCRVGRVVSFSASSSILAPRSRQHQGHRRYHTIENDKAAVTSSGPRRLKHHHHQQQGGVGIDDARTRGDDSLSRRGLFPKDRRTFLTEALAVAAVFGVAAPRTLPANAATATAGAEQGGLVSTSRVANLLRAVPTFVIVDRKGIPYEVVGEDAKPTAYFFTEYEEASRILKVARQSADRSIADSLRERKKKKRPPQRDEEEELVNPWKDARISSVPLDTAVTLVTKSSMSNFFHIAPSESAILDALTITGKDNLAEGKVPVFYYKDWTTSNAQGDNNDKISPVYFRKSELERAYKSSPEYDDKTVPDVQVSELFAVLGEMVKPGGTDEELKTLVFVPPVGSLDRARECARQGGKEPPFVLGQRNLVL